MWNSSRLTAVSQCFYTDCCAICEYSYSLNRYRSATAPIIHRHPIHPLTARRFCASRLHFLVLLLRHEVFVRGPELDGAVVARARDGAAAVRADVGAHDLVLVPCERLDQGQRSLRTRPSRACRSSLSQRSARPCARILPAHTNTRA